MAANRNAFAKMTALATRHPGNVAVHRDGRASFARIDVKKIDRRRDADTSATVPMVGSAMK